MFTAENAVGSSIVVLCALVTCTVLRRRSAAVRHIVLAAGIFAAASVAPLSLVLPAGNVSLSRAAIAPAAVPFAGGYSVQGTVSPQAPAGASSGGDMGRAALVLGCGIALATLVISIVRIARMTRMAARVQDERWLEHCARLSAAYGLKRPAVLLRTRTLHMIGTWGIRRPCVLLPSDAEGWDEPRMRVVLAHELAHERRRDWLRHMEGAPNSAEVWFK